MGILLKHPFILLFGALQLFFSAPGQTFLISLFVLPIFNELSLSNSLFAGVYSFATLSAALLLNPAGHLIDRLPPRKILSATTLLMAAGCAVLASAQSILGLFVGFFILRLIGQGVFGLTASTLISKAFHKNRAQALGIISLGFPLSEMIFPALALFMIKAGGWRMTYALFSVLFIGLMLPLQLFLLRKSPIRPGLFLLSETRIQPQTLSPIPLGEDGKQKRKARDYSIREVMACPYFYAIIVASCIPTMIMTGMFFHQTVLFQAQGWPMALLATGLGIYAVFKAIASVLIGPYLDRHGPVYAFVGLILLLGLGMILAGFGGPSFMVLIYFSFMGVALGLSGPVLDVVWPNLYGSRHLGSIKGYAATFRNGLTAFGPLPLALALDAGIGVEHVLLWTGIGILFLSSIPVIVSQYAPRINGLRHPQGRRLRHQR